MPKRIIIADDTEDMRTLLQVVFLGSDYTVVHEAADGDEAAEAWTNNRPPGVHAVILDQRMPGKTGLEVAEFILSQDPSQRVILFSANMTDDIRAHAERIGVSACIDKGEVATLPTHPALNKD